jgi:hypothetical protein
MQRLEVRYGERLGFVFLRPLRGDDEESVTDADTWSAIALLDRVLVDRPDAVLGAGQAAALTAADRDRVLAALYQREFGDRVASTSACPACGAHFDLDFRLSALCAAIVAEPAPRDGGAYVLADGSRIRVPTGGDELAAAGAADPDAALLARCRLTGDADLAAVSAALARIAPLLDSEMDATCPECGHVHEVRFDVQPFVLARLVADRPRRAREVHHLARSYGWSLSEILSLPRELRGEYVELIERGARAH